MLELLVGLLTKTLNMSEDDLKAIILKEGTEDELNEDALSSLLEKDASRISAIKEANKGSRDDQYKRGLKEAANRIEGELRDAFGLDEELTGAELIAKAKEINPGGTGDGKLTDDKVKAHPAYIALQNAKAEEIKNLNKEWEGKLKGVETEYSVKATRSTVNQQALQHIRSMNPILPEDASKANKRLNLVTNALASYNFSMDGDKIIVVDENGAQLMNEHNNPITFDELVGGIADDYFDFESGDESTGSGKGTGNKNEFGKKGFSKIKVPTTPEELEQAMNDAKSPEERTALSEAFLKGSKED